MSGTTLPLAPDASKGRSLGKYEVLSRLSTGGMAEIFLASQRGLAGFRKLVVLKQILPDIRGEEEFIRMFLDEAKVTAAFNHPHIAQVFDLDIAEGELFLAMEFVPGATLVEVARACRQASHPIPVGFSLMAVRDTAVALHYAHTFTDPLGHPSPVIHRDVAEKNIMVTYEGVTKLLDFGIAKSLARASRTAVGMVKGTSGYMSPEQIMGEPLDARSDLFSLGVVLHELLTGMRLFYAKQAEAMMNAVLKCDVTPPSRANKQIPPELDAIVLRALSKRREDRYASTLEFARALERAVGPLIWHPEQSSEVMRRLFADRREQTRQLLMAGPASGDVTGETSVAAMLAKGSASNAAPAPEAPEPLTLNNTTSSGPPEPPPRRPTVTAPAPKQPSASPRKATNTQPATTPPPPPPPDPEPRKAVLKAPPQKRLAGRGASSEPARPPPPPPSESPPPPHEEHTARTQPGRPALAPSEHTIRAQAPSRPAPPVSEEPVSRSEARPRANRGADTPRPVAAPQPPARNEETAMVRVPTLSAEPGSHAGVPSRRGAPARRRPPPQLPAAFPTGDGDITAKPSRGFPAGDDETTARPSRGFPSGDGEATTKPSRGFQENRRPRPEHQDDDEDAHVHTQRGIPAVGSESRVGRKVLAGLLVLLAVGAGVVGLGLDGGLVSSQLGLGQEDPDVARPTPIPPPKQRAPPQEQGKAPPANNGAGTGTPPPAIVENVPPQAPVTPVVVDTVEAPPEPEPDQAAPVADVEEDKPAKKPGRTTVKRSKESTRNSRRVTPDSSESSPVAPTGEPGFLTLVTEPYAKVYLGGQSLGDTPLFKVSLPSGKHTLKLVDGDGRALKLSVDIKPGDTTAVRVPLEMLSRQ
ncbi:protein kinase domain-containing protein [Corallococcus terminator]